MSRIYTIYTIYTIWEARYPETCRGLPKRHRCVKNLILEILEILLRIYTIYTICKILGEVSGYPRFRVARQNGAARQIPHFV